MNKYKGKVLCKKCKSNYHPEQYPMCWDCRSKQPSKVLKGYKNEGWESWKDATESSDPNF